MVPSLSLPIQLSPYNFLATAHAVIYSLSVTGYAANLIYAIFIFSSDLIHPAILPIVMSGFRDATIDGVWIGEWIY
jgi:hypothetical protein